MCGDFDDLEKIDDELFERFTDMAGRFGAIRENANVDAPTELGDERARADYMGRFFTAGLTRAMNDAANLPHGERMDALAGQAIVFARLAGFLAAQFPPESDLFRTVSGALLDGHNEPASLR